MPPPSGRTHLHRHQQGTGSTCASWTESAEKRRGKVGRGGGVHTSQKQHEEGGGEEAHTHTKKIAKVEPETDCLHEPVRLFCVVGWLLACFLACLVWFVRCLFVRSLFVCLGFVVADRLLSWFLSFFSCLFIRFVCIIICLFVCCPLL